MPTRRKTKKVASPEPAPMAITQNSPPTISGVCKVGEELTATPGTYAPGEIKNTKWYYSENGGADWVTKGMMKSHLLTEDDVGRVFKVIETVQEGEEEPEEFASEKTGVIYPADAHLGEVTVNGPATGNVGDPQTFNAVISGDAQKELLSYAWEVQDGDGKVRTSNVQWIDPTSNPATVTFDEPAVSCRIVAWVSSEQTNVVEEFVSGSTNYDSQVPAPPPEEPDAPLEKRTDTVIAGDPFVGQILTIVPGTAQGGTEPYTNTYSWQRGNQGTWHDIAGRADQAYTPDADDIGYSIRGITTITDKEGSQIVLPSLGTTSVVEEPAEIDPESGYTGWAQYNIASLLYHYRQWHNRDLQIGMIDPQTFTIQGMGRLDDLGRLNEAPNMGEVVMVWDWVCFHWTGTIEAIGSGTSGIFKLSCSGSGRFVPSGGATPTIIGEPPVVPPLPEPEEGES